jgi:hypothetical protein
MDAYPEGVTRSDHRGWIPLHVACSTGTDLAIIETLFEDYPETVLMKTHKGSDCIKCAKMSKGHPNEDAICEFIEKKIAEAEGRAVKGNSEEVGSEEDEKKEAQVDESDDESHHQDDDEVDLLDIGGTNVCAAGSGDDEGDLLGLSSDIANRSGDETKPGDLLMDIDATEAQDSIETPSVEDESEGRSPEALPPMPTNAPPSPADPKSATGGKYNNMDVAPIAFMPHEMTEESPTSTVDADFLSMPPAGDGLKASEPIAELMDSDMLGDIVLEEGSADIVKALGGNLIDL